jgi:hypothetical protein
MATPIAVVVSPIPATAAPASAVAVDWQRIAVRTVYAENAQAPPVGTLYLAFASLAVHDAATAAQKHGRVAAEAAVATAAHDVLKAYFATTSGANLDADLAADLASLRGGKAKQRGIAIGRDAAADMVASRVGDGRGDASIVYTKTPGPGVWAPAPIPGGMAAAWLGFVDPVADIEVPTLPGHTPMTSDAWAADYDEVRRVGRDVSSDRSQDQTDIARFFAGANPPAQYRNAFCAYLDANPLGLLPTTRMFARIDAAVATTFIETWRQKYDVGFWRPFEAIAGTFDDGNDDTLPEPGWAPLVPNPPYSDYTSGHGSATAPFAEVVRRTLGDDVPLALSATVGGVQVHRSYTGLSALEHDALNARIWGGLHYRTTMDHTYDLGHEIAARAMQAIH